MNILNALCDGDLLGAAFPQVGVVGSVARIPGSVP